MISIRRLLGTIFTYKVIPPSAIGGIVTGWIKPNVAKGQRQAGMELVSAVKSKKYPEEIKMLIKAFSSISIKDRCTILDIGCATGYYFEIFHLLFPKIKFKYFGVDYSNHNIDIASNEYKNMGAKFAVANADLLPFKNDSFDLVFSSATIMHTPEYRRAILESSRITKKYAIFARTPCISGSDNLFVKQRSYGSTYLDIFFTETKLTKDFLNSDLEVVLSLDSKEQLKVRGARNPMYSKLFLCEKIKRH